MVTLLVGIAILIVIIAIIGAIGFFVNTAMILLPWTIPATVLGVLAGFTVGANAPISVTTRRLMGGFITFVAVLGLGYAGLAIVPPKAPQPVAASDPLQLFPLNEKSLSETVPIHMGISAAIGAIGVVIALSAMKKERVVLELDDVPQ